MGSMIEAQEEELDREWTAEEIAKFDLKWSQLNAIAARMPKKINPDGESKCASTTTTAPTTTPPPITPSSSQPLPGPSAASPFSVARRRTPTATAATGPSSASTSFASIPSLPSKHSHLF